MAHRFPPASGRLTCGEETRLGRTDSNVYRSARRVGRRAWFATLLLILLISAASRVYKARNTGIIYDGAGGEA